MYVFMLVLNIVIYIYIYVCSGWRQGPNVEPSPRRAYKRPVLKVKAAPDPVSQQLAALKAGPVSSLLDCCYTVSWGCCWGCPYSDCPTIWGPY